MSGEPVMVPEPKKRRVALQNISDVMRVSLHQVNFKPVMTACVAGKALGRYVLRPQ